MIRWLWKASLWGAVIILVAACIGSFFQEDLQRAGNRFVKRQTQRSIALYGAGLPPIDEVRVLRIGEPSDKPSGLGTFRAPFQILSYDTLEIAILIDKTFAGEEAQEIARQWRNLHLHNEYMASCYSPHHVVQFRAKGAVVCEAVICFGCGNTSLPSFPTATLVSFESEPESPGYLKFRSLIEAAVGPHESNSSPTSPPDRDR